MTDGPFKNLQLTKRWKKFAELAHNETVEPDNKRVAACNAIVRDVLIESNRALLSTLVTHFSRAQLELDLASSVEAIFSCHSKSPFGDSLQRELAFRLNGSMPMAAYDEAIKATVIQYAKEVGNRIEEECLRSHELGDMKRSDLSLTVSQAKSTLNSLDIDKLSRVILSGDKDAFKEAASKQEGIDEGPTL